MKESPTFPRWHFGMLADRSRSKLLESAVEQANVKDRLVFEIGAGTGILALLCARHGAAHVITCEENPQLAAAAKQIVTASRYNDRVDVLAESAEEVINRRAHRWRGAEPHIIITETLDCGVVGEGFYDVARDIQRICSSATMVLPSMVEQYGLLVEAPAAWGTTVVPSKVLDFDLSPLNRFMGPYTAITEDLVRKRLSEIGLIRMYSYLKSDHDVTVSSTLTVSSSGICHGLLTFFRARYAGVIISNGPGPDRCYCWSLAFHPLTTPVALHCGMVVEVLISSEGRVEVTTDSY